MKSLAGADPEKKPDYRSQSLMELNKLEQKVTLLNEMLDNVDTSRGEKFVSGDVYDVSLVQYYSFFQIYTNYGELASCFHTYQCTTENSEMDFRCWVEWSRSARCVADLNNQS